MRELNDINSSTYKLKGQDNPNLNHPKVCLAQNQQWDFDW